MSYEISIESLNNSQLLINMLSDTPFFKSRGEVRRCIENKGLYINDVGIVNINTIFTKSSVAIGYVMDIEKNNHKITIKFTK